MTEQAPTPAPIETPAAVAAEAPKAEPTRKRVVDTSTPREVYKTRKTSFTESHPEFRSSSPVSKLSPAAPIQERAADVSPPDAAPAAEDAAQGQAEAAEATPATPELTADQKDAKEVSEHAKRMAKLVKDEERLTSEKRSLAKDREALTAKLSEANARIERLNTFEREGKADIIGALQKHMGISSDDLMRALINAPPSKQVQKAAATLADDPVIKSIIEKQKAIDDAASARAKEEEQTSINTRALQFRNDTISPFLKANEERFPLLIAFKGHDAAVQEVWDYLNLRFSDLAKEYNGNVPKNLIPQFDTSADELEALLKDQADRLDRARGKTVSEPKAKEKVAAPSATEKTAKPTSKIKTLQKPLSFSDAIRARPAYREVKRD